jgi:putative transcriptional regulator
MDKVVSKKTSANGKKRPSGPGRSRGTRLSPAGSRIVSAFEEAIEMMRAGEPLESCLTDRTYHAEFVPPSYGPDDVRRVRSLLGMSQVVFARFLGVGTNTIRSWEQGSRPPSAIARRFMGEIEVDPVYWRKRVARSLVV